MQQRTLGPFSVSAIGLGCMNLSHAYGAPVSAEQGERVLLAALDAGVTLFDTATLYGFGANENLVGRVLKQHRSRFTLASKCGMQGVDVAGDGKLVRVIDGRPDTLRKTCEDSLRRLQTDVIDLYYLHRWDKSVPIEESVGALGELVRRGHIRTVGLSEVSAATLRRAHAEFRITAVQTEYSLWTRNPEIAVLDACRELGVAFVAFSPVARGFLCGGLTDVSTLDAKDIRRAMPRFAPEAYAANLKLLAEIAGLTGAEATARMQQIYAEPIKPELIRDRIAQIRAAGVTVAGALSPQRAAEFSDTVIKAGVDLFVIRGTTVSAEHVSRSHEPLNLKEFIYKLDVPVIVGGAATYTAALHLMRTGAAGVLVGFGGGAASTTRKVLGIHAPMATAVADVAAARRDYMDETGGRYVHVIADGGLGTSGDIVKAISCGADAVMLGSVLARASEAPGRGWHWGQEAFHEELPRGMRVQVGTDGNLQQIFHGPSTRADGTTNLIGALRRAMATTGYSDLKEFQRVEVVVAPYHA